MKNSLNKYNRTREEASKLGMDTMRSIKIGIHPTLIGEIDAKE